MQFVNKDLNEILTLMSFSPFGFRLANEIFVQGPIAIFPKHIFHWNVAKTEEITEESLSLFHLIEPKLDVLIIGNPCYSC